VSLIYSGIISYYYFGNLICISTMLLLALLESSFLDNRWGSSCFNNRQLIFDSRWGTSCFGSRLGASLNVDNKRAILLPWRIPLILLRVSQQSFQPLAALHGLPCLISLKIADALSLRCRIHLFHPQDRHTRA